MSVRWKPLIILSGLFMSVALCGLLAFVFASGGGDVADFLEQARESRAQGKFDDAEIYYRQACQVAPRDAEVHQEVAAFYGGWVDDCPPERRAEIVGLRLRHLIEASKSDKTALAPRLALLEEALSSDNAAEQVHWAQQVAALAPSNPDALFVLATDSLEASPPKTSEAVRLLEALRKTAPDLGRTAYLEARLDEITGDRAAIGELLGRRLGSEPPTIDAPIDRLALLRLLGMQGEHASTPEELDRLLRTMSTHVEALLGGEGFAESNLHELGRLSKLFRGRVEELGGDLDGDWRAFADLIDAGFRDAMKRGDGPNLPLTLSYATQLYDRGRNGEALALVDGALTPAVLKAEVYRDSVMQLRELAIKLLLAESGDAERFEKARPHIEGLLASDRVEYQGPRRSLQRRDRPGRVRDQHRGGRQCLAIEPGEGQADRRPDLAPGGRQEAAPVRHRQGPLRHLADALRGPDPRPAVPARRPECRQRRAPIPRLGGLEPAAGELPRGGRAHPR